MTQSPTQPSTTCFATIVSSNYLAYARVLGDSLAAHQPGCSFELLVVDERDPAIDAAAADAGLRITWARELGLPHFDRLAFKFDLLELNTALKPTFLKRLFTRGHERVVYLDPDILVMRPLLPVQEALADSCVVLTPHTLHPVMDGSRPSDIDFLRTGAFNLGFIALRRSPDAQALLDWWEGRCLSQGFNDPGFGTFVDQKWLDLAPSYFGGVRILKHPGCNVAYWNLHERHLDEGPDGLRANGEPVCFFHFSGVDANRPELLSRHQNRHVPAPGSPLARLVGDYCDRLLAAGHARWRARAYTFSTLRDGTPITQLMRHAALVPGMPEGDWFDPASAPQRALASAGLHPRVTAVGRPNGTTTMDFDPADRRVRALHAVLRLAGRMIGPNRMTDLVRYGFFLSWRGNLSAVMLDRPFELRHLDERKDPRA